MSVAYGICAVWMVCMFMALSVVGFLVMILDWVVALYNKPHKITADELEKALKDFTVEDNGCSTSL